MDNYPEEDVIQPYGPRGEHPTRGYKGGSPSPSRKVYLSTHYSVAEFALAAQRRAVNPDTGEYWDRSMRRSDSWSGGKTVDQLVDMATGDGWHEKLAETLEIAEQAVKLADREHEIDVYQAEFDVSGSDVEIGRYLTGEPECMIDYPPQKVSAAGKVVTLVSAGAVSCAVEPEDYERRGQVLAALALALERLGHACELWIDFGAMEFGRDREYHVRILVKGTEDTVDPAMIMLAFAHPGMLRRLTFVHEDGHPDTRGWSGGGMPVQAWQAGFPEGTIFTPELVYGYSNKDPHTEMRDYLVQLGLLDKGE